jgi:hypothetical protein
MILEETGELFSQLSEAGYEPRICAWNRGLVPVPPFAEDNLMCKGIGYLVTRIQSASNQPRSVLGLVSTETKPNLAPIHLAGRCPGECRECKNCKKCFLIVCLF